MKSLIVDNKKLLIFIYFPFSVGASGGGNNFLKSLKNKLDQLGVLSPAIEDANVVLFNSHHAYKDIYQLKLSFPEKIFIQRIDGPMSSYTDSYDVRDYIVKSLNDDIADGSIYQSDWCHQENIKESYLNEQSNYTVIWNAPNPSFFSKKNLDTNSNKMRIVSTGWSSNKNKGSDTYLWLDKNLDFSQYQMDFIGNTEHQFENIKVIPSMEPQELGKKLKEYDFYIFPSRQEACSNALMEALHTGLPTIAFNGSSNIEIIPHKKWLYRNENEIPAILNDMVENYNHYFQKINMPTLDNVGEKYLNFCKKVYATSIPKKLSSAQKLKALLLINLYKLKVKVL